MQSVSSSERPRLAVRVTAAGLWTSPQAIRPLDAPALETPVRIADWVSVQGPTERRDLWDRLETQILLGDTVLVDEVVDEWAKVVVPSQPSRKDPRGYPGWLPVAQLANPAAETGDSVVVAVPMTELLDAPDGATVLPDVSFATILPVTDRVAGWVRVALPGDGTGWLAEANVAPYLAGGDLPSPAQLLAAGRQFLGLMYLAGGVCGRGLDCTGLIHGVYRRYGQVVPRDAADMTELGDPVDLSELQPGDLMFFRKPDTGYVYHAGICVNVIDGWPAMLHASQTDWNTIDTPITALRHSHLDSARRMHSG